VLTQQLSGAIAPLPQAFAVATSLYGQRCAAQKGGQVSSFVQGSRDGLPPQPGDLMPSPLPFDFAAATPVLGLGSDFDSGGSRDDLAASTNPVFTIQNAPRRLVKRQGGILLKSTSCRWKYLYFV
jgi:hypothetical protein